MYKKTNARNIVVRQDAIDLESVCKFILFHFSLLLYSSWFCQIDLPQFECLSRCMPHSKALLLPLVFVYVLVLVLVLVCVHVVVLYFELIKINCYSDLNCVTKSSWKN